MCLKRANEHQPLKCGTSGQIAADGDHNTFYYYDFTTTEKSNHNIMYKTPICLYKIWYNRECDDICTLYLTIAKCAHEQKCICTLGE